MNHQIWSSFDLFMDFTNLQKKKKGKGKGFTLIQRTGRSLEVGRPSGSAGRAEEATSEAGLRSAPMREESGSSRSRLHLNGRAQPPGRRRAGPTCRVHPQPPARTEQRQGAASAATCRRHKASPAMLCPPACPGDPAASNRGWNDLPGAPG